MPATWINDWNEIIRDVIYPDIELRQLMRLPKSVGIIEFIDKYFIRSGYSNQVLEHEDVRIVYGNTGAHETETPNVTKNEMSFDIYVKQEHLHNVGNDRLQLRTHLIAAKLIELLTKHGTSGKYLGGYRFWVKNEMDLGTRTTGYARYCVTFYYVRVY